MDNVFWVLDQSTPRKQPLRIYFSTNFVHLQSLHDFHVLENKYLIGRIRVVRILEIRKFFNNNCIKTPPENRKPLCAILSKLHCGLCKISFYAVGALTSLLTLREKAKGLPNKMNVINGAVEALPRLLHASWNQIMFLGFGLRWMHFDYAWMKQIRTFYYLAPSLRCNQVFSYTKVNWLFLLKFRPLYLQLWPLKAKLEHFTTHGIF